MLVHLRGKTGEGDKEKVHKRKAGNTQVSVQWGVIIGLG